MADGARPRQWQVYVTGETAARMMLASGVVQDLGNPEVRISGLTFFAESTGDAADQDSDAYPFSIAKLEEGTFPDVQCREVTGTGWRAF